jgi:uncharacterized membrane protein YraQ (UPF0718 family)
MLVLLGWQFTLAEFVGAPLMVVFLVFLFWMFLSRDLLEQAKKQADKGIAGRMEGHAEMDMSVTGGGSLWQRMTSDRGRTAMSHYFVMDWAAVWLDIGGGLLVAMAVAALLVDLIFGGFALIPVERKARVVEASITWDYTTWLDLAFMVLAGFLVWRFLKTGGLGMLRMMNRPHYGRTHGHAQ